jgi:DNA-binding transcriptional ArsR family regulator
MTMNDPVTPTRQRTLLTAPSLAMDLSWVLSVAVRPHWRHKFPTVSEQLARRGDLAERVRTFWSDSTRDTCFTEMQVLAHHAGALGETSPPALWAALEGAISTVPTDIALESELPEDRLVFLGRLERLKEFPALFRSYMDLLREVWEPMDEIWQPTLPMLREAGRQVVAEIESGRALGDVTRGESCAITSFGLAQPTISMHMKSLRESGLVRSERNDGRLKLSADPDALASLVDELRGVVPDNAGTPPSA